MRIAITVPVFVKNGEHKRFLDLTTESLISKQHDLVFIPVENYIDSGFVPIMYRQKENAVLENHIVKPEGDQSVSKAWNMGIDEAKRQKCEYVIVINSDIVLKSNAIDRLVAFAESHPEAVMWTASEYAEYSQIEDAPEDEGFNEHPHFSCFMVRTDFFKNVGRFDENFKPAYCEDGDMHARLALANLKAYTYGGARFYHFGSRTIKTDRELWDKNTQTFPKNQQYFLEKWGHPIVNETAQMRELYYKSPYNSGKSLDYWKKEGE